jgi:hypothetical protein
LQVKIEQKSFLAGQNRAKAKTPTKAKPNRILFRNLSVYPKRSTIQTISKKSKKAKKRSIRNLRRKAQGENREEEAVLGFRRNPGTVLAGERSYWSSQSLTTF